MKKISRHETASTNQPPRRGPTAAATPPSPDHAPTAAPRPSGSKLAWMIARLPGVSSAAPMPWKARAAINVPAEGAIPHSSDPIANQITPISKIRRRP